MEQGQPSRETITERTLALPYVDGGNVIEETQALAFWEDLRTNNPGLYDHLNRQIAHLDTSIGEQLGDDINPHIRRGIIARVAIASAAQVVNDTGQSIIDISLLKDLLSYTVPDTPA